VPTGNRSERAIVTVAISPRIVDPYPDERRADPPLRATNRGAGSILPVRFGGEDPELPRDPR
jgi:hypothetical protein